MVGFMMFDMVPMSFPRPLRLCRSSLTICRTPCTKSPLIQNSKFKAARHFRIHNSEIFRIQRLYKSGHFGIAPIVMAIQLRNYGDEPVDFEAPTSGRMSMADRWEPIFFSEFQSCHSRAGVGKCPILGILDITL